MASQAREALGSQTSWKCYGNTTVDGNANVQLGDSVQRINIHGGLHIHYNQPFNALFISNLFLQFQNESLCPRLLDRIHRMDDVSPSERDVQELVDIHKRLLEYVGIFQDRLTSMAAENGTDPTDKSFHDFVSLELQRIEELAAKVVQLISTSLICTTRNPDAPVWRDTPQQIDENNQWRVTGEHNNSRIGMQAEISVSLQDEELKQQFEMLTTLHTRLMPHLAALLNLKHNKHALNVLRPHLEQNSSQHQATDRIVGATTINRASASGPEPYLAVLSKASGDTVTVDLNNSAQMDDHLSSTIFGHNFRKYGDELHNFSSSQILKLENALNIVKTDLSFPEEDDRRSEVKSAHHNTFEWVLQDYRQTPSTNCSRLRTWLLEGEGCFWINGKAGSGKSTLMKYLHQHALFEQLLSSWANGRRLLILSFFFWNAGQPLQKSYEGILRSLLRQILVQRPDLFPILFPKQCERHSQSDVTWVVRFNETVLQTALLVLSQNMPRDLAIVVMIDGIDEYSGVHYDFCQFLVEVVNSCSSIKALVSSRPIPACHQVFSSYPGLRLQDLTSGDIQTYIRQVLMSNQLLKDLEVLQKGFAAELENTLIEKASGVFLWIVLVVRSLLIGLGEYDNRTRLMRKVDELPTDLEKLYDHMFGTMSIEHQQEGALLLKLACRATEIQLNNHEPAALTALQLYTAVQASTNPDYSISLASSTLEMERLKVKATDGILRSRCCGLLEVQYTRNEGQLLRDPEVSFLHRTVYDYLQDSVAAVKIDAVCKLKLYQLDFVLITSMFHMISRAIAANCTVRRQVLACLAYSRELSLSGDRKHIDLLLKVDEMTLQYALNHSQRLPMTAAKIYPLAFVHFEKLQHVAMATFAMGSSPQYFRAKVKKASFTRSAWINILFSMCGIYQKLAPMSSGSTWRHCLVENLGTILDKDATLYKWIMRFDPDKNVPGTHAAGQFYLWHLAKEAMDRQ